MATSRARFSAIPSLPLSDITDWQYYTLNALKDNVELLTGIRRGEDNGSQAVTKASVTVDTAAAGLQGLSAQGSTVLVNNTPIVDPTDYQRLVRDVEAVRADLATVRDTLNILITQLKA